MNKTYGPTDIQVLSLSEAIRKRPRMYIAYKKVPNETNPLKTEYIGDTNDPHCLTNLIIEALCLSRASAASGSVSEINILVTNGTHVFIADNGPGISMEKDKWGKTLIEMLATVLHACKNIKHEDVQHFCTNGVVVVNALTEYFNITNKIDGVAYSYMYKAGKPEQGPFLSDMTNTNGLMLDFKFDPEIFGGLKIDPNDLITEIEKIKQTTPAVINLVFDN